LLNLIVHLELGNQQLVPYALKSTQRYLNLRNRVYKFENIFLHFINRILKTRDKKEEHMVYTALLDEFRLIGDDNFEKTAFEYFDFDAWAQSKVTGEDFRSIIRKKALI